MKGESGGAGGAPKGEKEEEEFGNWSMANATLLFTLRGNFRLRPCLSAIQTSGLESKHRAKAPSRLS